jgi:hypothetical protein
VTYRILVTGSRSWTDRSQLAFQLGMEIGHAKQEVIVVHGDCPDGADRIARDLCSAYGVEQEKHPAKWADNGKAAGFIRNAEMVDAGADVCLAFIADESPGATHCSRLAANEGIRVRRFTK